jgi:hypothetical protein
MKRVLALLLALGLTAAASAQTAVSLTNVLDAASANTGDVHAATYSVSDNKFLGSAAGAAIRIYNGTTGAYESDLNISGTSPSGLGFFGLVAGSDGSIFGFEDSASTLWQWDNVADATPASAATGVPFTRSGTCVGSGAATKLVLTGSADNGPLHIFTTANDVTYTETETTDAGAPNSKLCCAVNTAIDKAWAIGDTGGQPINKAVKSGTWAPEGVTFLPVAGSIATAAMAYDSKNNVLFAWSGTTVYALHGDTGADLGNAAVANGIITGYGGGVVSSVLGSGTVWLCGRNSAASTNLAMQKFTYTVTGPIAGVADWTIY